MLTNYVVFVSLKKKFCASVNDVQGIHGVEQQQTRTFNLIELNFWIIIMLLFLFSSSSKCYPDHENMKYIFTHKWTT